jgi:hypothetical protein
MGLEQREHDAMLLIDSGQMLFTMAIFGEALIAAITLLLAVRLDDSL